VHSQAEQASEAVCVGQSAPADGVRGGDEGVVLRVGGGAGRRLPGRLLLQGVRRRAAAVSQHPRLHPGLFGTRPKRPRQRGSH